jgi:hypothetical protein
LKTGERTNVRYTPTCRSDIRQKSTCTQVHPRLDSEYRAWVERKEEEEKRRRRRKRRRKEKKNTENKSKSQTRSTSSIRAGRYRSLTLDVRRSTKPDPATKKKERGEPDNEQRESTAMQSSPTSTAHQARINLWYAPAVLRNEQHPAAFLDRSHQVHGFSQWVLRRFSGTLTVVLSRVREFESSRERYA